MSSTRTISAFLAVLLAAAAPSLATAGSARELSSKQVLEDGQYVLVMVSPLPIDEEAEQAGGRAEEAEAIRTTYTQSGLYRNDGTATPLWTMPYHAHYRAIVTRDGKHLVIENNNWGCSGYFVSFYSNGNELATFCLGDLIVFRRLKSKIYRRRGWGGATVFDRDALTFTYRTSHGEEIVFDVTTGKIISHWSPFRVQVGIGLAVLAATVTACLVWLIRRRRKRATAEPNPSISLSRS